MSRLVFSEKKEEKIECCLLQILLGTLKAKAPITTAADDIQIFFLYIFSQSK